MSNLVGIAVIVAAMFAHPLTVTQPGAVSKMQVASEVQCGGVPSAQPSGPALRTHTIPVAGDPLGIVVSERSGHGLALNGHYAACAATLFDVVNGRVLRVVGLQRGQFAGVDDRANRFIVVSAPTNSTTRVGFVDTWSGRLLRSVTLSGSPDGMAIYAPSDRVFVTTYGYCTDPVSGCPVVTHVLDAAHGTLTRTSIAGSIRGVDEVHARVYVLAPAGLAGFKARTGNKLWVRRFTNCNTDRIVVINRTGTLWLWSYVAPKSSFRELGMPGASASLHSHVPLSGPPVNGTGRICILNGANGSTAYDVRVPNVSSLRVDMVDEPANAVLTAEGRGMGAAVVLRNMVTGQRIVPSVPGTTDLPAPPIAVDSLTGLIYSAFMSAAQGGGRSAITVFNPFTRQSSTLAHVNNVLFLAVASRAHRVMAAQSLGPGKSAVTTLCTRGTC